MSNERVNVEIKGCMRVEVSTFVSITQEEFNEYKACKTDREANTLIDRICPSIRLPENQIDWSDLEDAEITERQPIEVFGD